MSSANPTILKLSKKYPSIKKIYLFFGTFDGKIYGYDIDRLKLSNNFFDDLNVVFFTIFC